MPGSGEAFCRVVGCRVADDLHKKRRTVTSSSRYRDTFPSLFECHIVLSHTLHCQKAMDPSHNAPSPTAIAHQLWPAHRCVEAYADVGLHGDLGVVIELVFRRPPLVAVGGLLLEDGEQLPVHHVRHAAHGWLAAAPGGPRRPRCSWKRSQRRHGSIFGTAAHDSWPGGMKTYVNTSQHPFLGALCTPALVHKICTLCFLG